MENKGLRRALALAAVCLCAGCMGMPQQGVREKLMLICDDDLEYIVSEIRANDPSALLDRPYYRITEYSYFPQSSMFSHKAVVAFYYFKTIQMKQIRKYRYSPSEAKWNRYYKEYGYELQ